MKYLKIQAIFLSIIYGLLPLIEFSFRLFDVGIKLTIDYFIIVGIISLVLVSFPLGIFIIQIKEKIRHSKYLYRIFIIALIINTLSIPLLGLECTISTVPSMIVGWIIVPFYAIKPKEINTNILDEGIL